MIEPAEPATATEVARHYDQLDRFYRDIWGDHVHHGCWITGRESPEQAARNLVDLVAEEAGLRESGPGARVLDVGCGYGATAAILAREYGAVVTGLTVSPAQAAYAERTVPRDGNPQVLLENWEANRRAPRSADVVIAVESTEHMRDRPRVFLEMARVLRPGGRLVVCAWLAGSRLTPWQERHLVAAVCREGRLAGMGTEEDYRQWMTAAGFRIVRTRDISREVRRTWPVCVRRVLAALLFQPACIRFLLDPRNDNRIFALTMLRIWLAYRCGAMRYVVFSAVLPGGDE